MFLTPAWANSLYRLSISSISQRSAEITLSGSTITGVRRWGILLYPVNSTRFGSTRIHLTSEGEERRRIVQRNELIATDFPEPVWPAIRTCGIRARSAIIGLPETSSPRATASLL